MPLTSRSGALRLASLAHEVGAEALRGPVQKNSEGRWAIGYVDIESWLSRHAGREVVLVVAAVEHESAPPPSRTCRTCGNEYTTPTCPHCDEVRSRLRRK